VLVQVSLEAKHVLAVSGLADVCVAKGYTHEFCALLTHLWNAASGLERMAKMAVQAAVCRALGRLKALPEGVLKFVRQHVVRLCSHTGTLADLPWDGRTCLGSPVTVTAAALRLRKTHAEPPAHCARECLCHRVT
jgi:hypothetical protein